MYSSSKEAIKRALNGLAADAEQTMASGEAARTATLALGSTIRSFKLRPQGTASRASPPSRGAAATERKALNLPADTAGLFADDEDDMAFGRVSAWGRS